MRSHHIPHHHLTPRRRAIVEFRVHAALDAFLRKRLLEFLADRGVLLVVGNGAAALAEVDGAVVHELLTRPAGTACALIVGAMPGGDAQAVRTDAEVLVEPVAAHR